VEKPPRLISPLTKLAFMPKFIDVHKMNPLTEHQLKQAQTAAKDEFGVTHENIMYSETENKVFCVLNAPNKEAVEKHHGKIGLKPDWIHEVKTTK
jgi:hypothetical protein